MQSGGLSPPNASRAPGAWSPQNSTEATLAEADSNDSGRGLDFFYVEGELGAEYLALEAFHGPLLPAGSKTSGIGVSLGAAFGLRLLYFSVGPRFRFAEFSDFHRWSLGLDVGWRVPLGRLEPYGVIGAGYSNLGVDALRGVTMAGYDIRLGGGIDYYLSNVVSVGGSLTVEIVRLARSNFPDTRESNPDPATLSGAYGFGLALTPSAVVGLHF